MSSINVEAINTSINIYSKPIYYDTLKPYQVPPHGGIEYTACRDFNHISRYKGLRQISHNFSDISTRFVTLETPNGIQSQLDFEYYDVPLVEENRLDIIANKFYGNPRYSWILAYMNNIEDGYTVREGQKLKIIKDIGALFNKGELLAPIPPLQLNLGEE